MKMAQFNGYLADFNRDNPEFKGAIINQGWVHSNDQTFHHEKFLIESVDGNYKVLPGDWVVKDEQGNFGVVKSVIDEALHEKLKKKSGGKLKV